MKAAHEAGTIVSYDLNFRSKLWSSKEAIETTKPLVPYIDCLIGNEEDFQKVLGYDVEGVDVEKGGKLDTTAFKAMVNRVVKDYPEHQGRRHDAPRREDGPRERLVGHHVARRHVLRRPAVPGPRDRRPRRRRRRLRLRLHLRLPHRQDRRKNASTSASPTARC